MDAQTSLLYTDICACHHTLESSWYAPTDPYRQGCICPAWMWFNEHYSDVIMGTMATQITSLTIVYSTVYSGADQRKHQSSSSLAFVQGIELCSYFYPRPVLAFGYCRCLRACVCVYVSDNHELVRAIIHQPFKLGSPNLDQRCKRHWLRALLFCGLIELQSQNLPHFELVHAITHHQ